MKNAALIGIFTGVLIGTSYIPLPPWAVLFCFVPLWTFWLQAHSYKQVFFSSWVANFLVTLIGFHWIAFTAHEYGRLPWPVALGVLLIFCSFNNYFLIVAGLSFRLLHTKVFTKMNLWQTGALLALLTFLSQYFAHGIFPWHFGYSLLAFKIQAFQFADLIGFSGLALVLALLNIPFFVWVQLPRADLKKKAILPLSSVGVLILLHIAGTMYKPSLNSYTDEINILQVQPNIGNFEKLQQTNGVRYQRAAASLYFKAVDDALKDYGSEIDLTIWPETAYPVYLDGMVPDSVQSKGISTVRLERNVKKWNIGVLTGAYSRDTWEEARENGYDRLKSYNALFMIGKNGQATTPPYRKTVLLAFGEYLPGESLYPWVRDLVPTIADFGTGPGPTILPFEDVKIGAQICYEGLFPQFSVGLAQKDADIFVNVTNDSWFGTTAEPWQHMYMTLARGVENRRPLVRNTNTGISTVILANGDLLTQSPLKEKWTHLYKVKFQKNSDLSLYSKVGYTLPHLLFFGLLLLTGGLALARRRK
jgi:apolipoprotein N-acyltransferase